LGGQAVVGAGAGRRRDGPPVVVHLVAVRQPHHALAEMRPRGFWQHHAVGDHVVDEGCPQRAGKPQVAHLDRGRPPRQHVHAVLAVVAVEVDQDVDAETGDAVRGRVGAQRADRHDLVERGLQAGTLAALVGPAVVQSDEAEPLAVVLLVGAAHQQRGGVAAELATEVADRDAAVGRRGARGAQRRPLGKLACAEQLGTVARQGFVGGDAEVAEGLGRRLPLAQGGVDRGHGGVVPAPVAAEHACVQQVAGHAGVSRRHRQQSREPVRCLLRPAGLERAVGAGLQHVGLLGRQGQRAVERLDGTRVLLHGHQHVASVRVDGRIVRPQHHRPFERDPGLVMATTLAEGAGEVEPCVGIAGRQRGRAQAGIDRLVGPAEIQADPRHGVPGAGMGRHQADGRAVGRPGLLEAARVAQGIAEVDMCLRVAGAQAHGCLQMGDAVVDAPHPPQRHAEVVADLLLRRCQGHRRLEPGDGLVVAAGLGGQRAEPGPGLGGTRLLPHELQADRPRVVESPGLDERGDGGKQGVHAVDR